MLSIDILGVTNKMAEIYFTKDHEWIKVEDNIGVVGITAYASEQLGDIVFVELPEEGMNIEIGKDIAVVESVKAAADVYAPVSGEVSDINNSLESAPENVNSDPYTDGWLYKMKSNQEINEDNYKALNLMNFNEYQELLEEES